MRRLLKVSVCFAVLSSTIASLVPHYSSSSCRSPMSGAYFCDPSGVVDSSTVQLYKTSINSLVDETKSRFVKCGDESRPVSVALIISDNHSGYDVKAPTSPKDLSPYTAIVNRTLDQWQVSNTENCSVVALYMAVDERRMILHVSPDMHTELPPARLRVIVDSMVNLIRTNRFNAAIQLFLLSVTESFAITTSTAAEADLDELVNEAQGSFMAARSAMIASVVLVLLLIALIVQKIISRLRRRRQVEELSAALLAQAEEGGSAAYDTLQAQRRVPLSLLERAKLDKMNAMLKSIKVNRATAGNRHHDDCAICLEKLSLKSGTFKSMQYIDNELIPLDPAGQQIVQMPQCSHCFHAACILPIINGSNPRCPLCRTEINVNFSQSAMIGVSAPLFTPTGTEAQLVSDFFASQLVDMANVGHCLGQNCIAVPASLGCDQLGHCLGCICCFACENMDCTDPLNGGGMSAEFIPGIW